MADDQNETASAPITFNANYVIDESDPITFIDHMTCLGTDNEFYLAFFQTQVPLMVGTLPAVLNRKCVSRLVMTPTTMAEVVRAINDTWDKHQKAQEGKKEE